MSCSPHASSNVSSSHLARRRSVLVLQVPTQLPSALLTSLCNVHCRPLHGPVGCLSVGEMAESTFSSPRHRARRVAPRHENAAATPTETTFGCASIPDCHRRSPLVPSHASPSPSAAVFHSPQTLGAWEAREVSEVAASFPRFRPLACLTYRPQLACFGDLRAAKLTLPLRATLHRSTPFPSSNITHRY